jgi:hypothetical protein
MEYDTKLKIDASVINKLLRDEWVKLAGARLDAEGIVNPAVEIALVAFADKIVDGLQSAEILAIARGQASLVGSTTTTIKYVEHQP